MDNMLTVNVAQPETDLYEPVHNDLQKWRAQIIA